MRSVGWKLTSVALAIACAGGGLYAYRSVRPSAAAASVRTVTATVDTITEVLSGTGAVEAATTRTLAFSSSGTLTALQVKLGDTVAEGDEIATVDPKDAEDSLAQAKSSLRLADARLTAVTDGLTAVEREQLRLQSSSSASSLEQAQKAVETARETVALNEKGYATAIETARTNAANTAETATFSAANTATQVDNSRLAIDTAEKNAVANARTYQVQLETAQANVDSAKATADQNAKQYQVTIDLAVTNAANTKTNIDLANVSSQAQFDQATGELTVNQTALVTAQAEQAAAQGAYAAAQGNEGLAKATYDAAVAALVAPATCDSTPSCLQASNSYKAAQTATNAARNVADAAATKVASAQTKVNQQQNTVTNLTNSRIASAAKDSQSLTAAEATSVQNARTAQEVGLAKDQVSIRSGDTALKNAVAAQTTGIDKDQSAIAAAKVAYQTALTNQEVATLKDHQTAAANQQQIDNATTARTTGRARDRQTLDSARNQLRQSQTSYQQTLLSNKLKLAPAKAADLESASAAVFNAQLQVEQAEEAVVGTTLKAPISGTITTLNGEVGLTVTASTSGGSGSANSNATASTFAIITDLSAMRIKLGVSEANAAKITVGQSATITFDALTGVSIASTVDRVDSVATTTNGVASYGVILSLEATASDLGVKPGMTAQTRVTVNQAVDVITLPASAIRSLGGRSVVQVYDAASKKSTPTPVETGVKGEGGTEIRSGIDEGAVIALPAVQATTSQTQQTGRGQVVNGAGGGIGGIGGGGTGGAGGAGPGGPR